MAENSIRAYVCAVIRSLSIRTSPSDDFDMSDEPMDDDDDGQPSDLQENQDFAHDEDFGDRYDGCDEY